MNRFTNQVKNSMITIELGGINEQISTGNISIDMLRSIFFTNQGTKFS